MWGQGEANLYRLKKKAVAFDRDRVTLLLC